jgi:hypothetical protein
VPTRCHRLEQQDPRAASVAQLDARLADERGPTGRDRLRVDTPSVIGTIDDTVSSTGWSSALVIAVAMRTCRLNRHHVVLASRA